ncbi:MAG: chitobiase/beta-hexosaminidase C-terminal domain-containing protein [Bacteroidales bacterium]|jgi:hypothetical protein|nr:chitobiase/beta-hexosaminidase C-terminal domain-containing protein [Bacteroidales bacterium]
MKKRIFLNAILLAFLCLIGIANLKAENEVAYRINFTNSATGDASGAVSPSNFIADLVTGGAEYISACTQTNNTYKGIGGVKLSSANDRGKFTLSLSELGQVNATKIVVSAAAYNNDVEQIAVNGSQTANLTAAAAEYEFTLAGSALTAITVESKLKRCRIYYIDVYVASNSTSAVVATPTIAPTAGFYTTPQDITLGCDTADATIRYTLDGTDPTSASTLYTTPFQLNTTATVKARAWKAGLDSSAVATATYTFPVEVSDIAAFMAAHSATSATVYKITGDVTFIYRNNRNIYVEDASGGLLIYDNTVPVITSTYTNGDVISGGILGTYTLYNGLSELIPVQDMAPSNTNNGAVAPVTATFAQLIANPASYMSRLVKVEGIAFDNGSFNTSGATSITVRQAGDSLTLRNSFKTVVLTVDSGILANVAALLSIENTSLMLYPRDNDDISILTPFLEANPDNLLVSDTIASTFTVTAANLTSSITIASTNPDFQVTPATLPASDATNTVSVTFTGTANATGQIIISSGTLSDTVAVTGEIYVAPVDTVIYAVGFESGEGFLASQSYQNAAIAYTGPTDSQWGTIYGTPSTTAPITGGQSMQMRWYTGTPAILGSTETNFDLHNVTKVTFKAKNTVAGTGLNVTATYSIDGGYTWTGDSTYALTTNADDFTYFITDSGQYYNVRLKFQMALQESNPTGTVRLVIDEIKVYGVLGLVPTVVETPVISPGTGNYFTPQSVSIACVTENAEIRYTLDGSAPVMTSPLYTAAFMVDTTAVVKAKGFKAGYDASNIAAATYTFPVKVPDIAAWKAANTTNNDTPYTITGDVTFVFKNGNNIYVEDATGGLLIFDNATIITETYTEGDIIGGGITGQCQMYGGMRQLTPLLNTLPATANNGEVAPAVVTATALVSNFDGYESRLVRINHATFASGEFNTANATNINFTQDDTTLIVCNSFKTLDMTVENGTVADIIGFAAVYNGSIQLYPRNNADIIIIPDTVAMPYFTINADNYESGDTITIAADVLTYISIFSNTENATVYYTTDNSEPTTSSTLYSEPVQGNVIAVIKAIAVKEGLINSAVSTVYISIAESINTIGKDLLTLYPNPAQSFIQLNNLLEVQAQTIALYSAYGQLVGKYAVTGNSAEISLSDMAAGAYFVQIATPKGYIIKKITKM